jgi:hypothetical protein
MKRGFLTKRLAFRACLIYNVYWEKSMFLENYSCFSHLSVINSDGMS